MWPTSWGCDVVVVFPGGICFLWRIFLLSAEKKREFTMIFFNAKVLGTQGA
jgi:hypothetical protein